LAFSYTSFEVLIYLTRIKRIAQMAGHPGLTGYLSSFMVLR
jgi:hypothetical protein